MNSRFVKGDCHHLPFKDKAFNLATCYHVIEHVRSPVKLLKELLRIAERVHIRCPYRISYTAKSDPTHINYFNKSWFGKVAKKHGWSIWQSAIRIDRERHLFYHGFILPLEISVWLFSSPVDKTGHKPDK